MSSARTQQQLVHRRSRSSAWPRLETGNMHRSVLERALHGDVTRQQRLPELVSVTFWLCSVSPKGLPFPRLRTCPDPSLHQSQRPSWPGARGRVAINAELFSGALAAYRLRVLPSAEKINTNITPITNRACSPHASPLHDSALGGEGWQ